MAFVNVLELFTLSTALKQLAYRSYNQTFNVKWSVKLVQIFVCFFFFVFLKTINNFEVGQAKEKKNWIINFSSLGQFVI